jgi:GTP-binding protein LepA
MNQDRIRNFAIIAHIDHGKSTLADRLMELTGTVARRDMQAQLLDSNPIERERGITIKLAPVRMYYQYQNESYILNLIDTPGHVDFGYEVSRSLAACEGAILVVDATQGVQAQTIANLTQARKNHLTVIPVVNKIDMPMAEIEKTEAQIVDLGFARGDILHISAKTGQGVPELLAAVITRVPAPGGTADAPTRALVFSSQYDPHKGVVVFVRVVDGAIRYDPAITINFLQSNATVAPIELGYFAPKFERATTLATGEVGYIATGLKDVRQAKVGDTITLAEPKKTKGDADTPAQHPAVDPLPGYREPKPMVFVGLYPLASDEFTLAREAMEKYRLSDSAFTFRPVTSMALGNGFHCGFLGLLHAEVVQERLSREYGLNLLATAPSVEYLIELNPGVNPSKAGITNTADTVTISDGGRSRVFYRIQSATEFPDPTYLSSVREPMMTLSVYTPKKYVGAIMQLSTEKRGEYIDLVYQGETAQFTYILPLSEMIVDFFDRLKSVTEGYASLDYEFFDYQEVDAVKVDILVNFENVDALAFLVVREQAHRRGKEIVARLADVLPRQQFNIPVQAAIGGQVIARDDIKPFRKDVIQKLYGGDRTRKDKLLKKQKKGKEKMKMVGRVEIPQTAFFDVLRKR